MASQQSPAGHKPTMTEKVQEKVTGLKEKLTGHGHHSHPQSGTASTTTPSTTMQKATMMDKVKKKLPGYHATTGHDPSKYESEQGTNGYGTSGYEPAMGQQEDTHGTGHGASTGFGHDTTTSSGSTFSGSQTTGTGGF